MSDPEPITTVAEFLAHALELEEESADRYRQLADSMEVHNNPEVATLFDRLAELGDLHIEEVRRRAAGLDLPPILPWEFKWTCPEGPESPCMEDAHYLMTVKQAFELALHNEIRGRDYYAQVAATSPNPEARRIAEELREEEDEHVDLLRQWIARSARAHERQVEDLDPPNMPE